jgi:hypothetical protein
MKKELHQDLDWYAFLYVANEMTPEQNEAFEALLDEDQTAREAVARSVELSTTLAASYSPLAQPASSAGWTRSLAMAALGAAACLLLVFLVDQFRPASPPVAGDAEAGAVSHSSPELAILWSETRAGWDLTTDSPLAADELSLELEPWSEDELEEDAQLAAPPWMTAALSDLTGGALQEGEESPWEN